MEEDDMKAEKKVDEGGKAAEGTFATINIVGDVDRDRDSLIGYKKKREKKYKKLPLKINQKKSRRPEPSAFQQIFNIISRSDVITENVVREAALKHRYDVDRDQIDYFLELGRAKASIKKYGLPGDICKHDFHFFTFSKIYDATTVLTDDKVVWNVIYADAYTNGDLKDFSNLVKNSKIVNVSVVSEKVFSCKNVYSGYIQDFLRNSAVITSVPLDEQSVANITKAVNDNSPQLFLRRLKLPNDIDYNYYQYESVILCGSDKANLNSLLETAKKVKCFNSKNKLSNGLKELKTNDKIGTYINYHEGKVTDFSPACLFTEPAMPNLKFFINASADLNTVYNTLVSTIKDKKSLITLRLPPDFIFWDNIGSFIQLIGLISLIGDDVKNELKNEIASMIEIYNKNRDVFSAWKRIYSLFEHIVVSFYDGVNRRLSIDSVIKLEEKALQFISDYLYLKNDVSYGTVRDFLRQLPFPRLMLNFFITSAPYELVSAIAKLITILKTGRTIKYEAKIDDLFRSIGVLCIKVFYGGDYAMIPKVRSPASFLGNAEGKLTNETLKKNLNYLIDAFKEDVKKDLDEGGKPLDYEKMDQMINAVMDNSDKNLKDNYIHNNLDEIKKQIRSDDVLMKSLREDIQELVNNGETEADIIAYADFLDNPLFNSFINAVKKVSIVASNNMEAFDTPRIIGSLKIKPGAYKKLKKKKKVDKIAAPTSLDALEVQPVVIVDKNKFMNSVTKYKESKTPETLFKDFKDETSKVVYKIE